MNKFKFWYSPFQPLSGVIHNYLREKKFEIELIRVDLDRDKTRSAGILTVPTLQVIQNEVVIDDMKGHQFFEIHNNKNFKLLDEFIKKYNDTNNS